ncbi:MAG: choice-of-anchor Q domain-containing protein [Thermomicrobiales bacterium]
MLAIHHITRRLGLALIAILLGPLLATMPAAQVRASSVLVNKTADTYDSGGCAGTGTGSCSLRDAVVYANSHAGTVISVPAGLYKLTIPPSGSDGDTTGDLDLYKDMTINGAGAGVTTIDGGVIADGIFAAIHASVTLNGLTLANGLRFTPSLVHGGALFVDLSTTVVVNNCAFFHNLDIGYSGSGTAGGSGMGGAIVTNDTLEVNRSTFTNNSAQGGDGDVGKNGGGAYGGAIEIANSSTLTAVSDSTFTGNTAIGGPGGNGDPSGSLPGPGAPGGQTGGGAIYFEGGVVVAISGSTFVSNSAVGGTGGTGALGPFSGGAGGAGGGGLGGAVLLFSSQNIPYVSNSTFVSNNTTGGRGGNGGGSGNVMGSGGVGGFTEGGAISTSVPDTSVTNVTIDGNSAVGGIGGVGGGTHGAPGSAFGGGIYSGDSAQVVNTIISNNGAGGNCSGTITNGGHNLQFNPNTGCGNTPFIVGDPKLTPLGNYGGPTKTRGIGPGSAALDAGDDTYCGATPVAGLDQRGIRRPQGAHCDIGAYEYAIVTTPPSSRGGPTVGGLTNPIPPPRPGVGNGNGTPGKAPTPRQ